MLTFLLHQEGCGGDDTPQENAIAAAEHTVAMMLSISRKIPKPQPR